MGGSEARHFGNVSRLAVVGESSAEEWMTRLSKPFTGAEVRFFDVSGFQKAHDWTA